MIPYGCQDITESDIDFVGKVLRSEFITQGTVGKDFEHAIEEYCGVNYAITVNSATSALHIACLALGLGQGDWLWTSPITFVASANCGRFCGAEVDFIDIDPSSYNISIEVLTRKLELAEIVGKLPKIVVPVHFSGQSCDMESIYNLSKRYGFHIIEDASHAAGGRYKGLQVGNCSYSDITVFSFHPVKMVTTGEGGVALTNDETLARKMTRLRSHGITRDEYEMVNIPDGPWYYEQIELGFNYRMTDFQAALGISQFKRLDSYVDKRTQLADQYGKLLSELPIYLPEQSAYTNSSWHLYVICLDFEEISNSYKNIFNSMTKQGIGVMLHYIPVHFQPYYQSIGFRQGDFPEAEHYYRKAMSIPLFPTMSDVQQEKVVYSLSKALN